MYNSIKQRWCRARNFWSIRNSRDHKLVWTVEAVARRCSIKKDVLRKFTGKHLYQSLFFNKVTVLRSATFLIRDSVTDVFLWILKFLRTPFSQNTSGLLLLELRTSYIRRSYQSKYLARSWSISTNKVGKNIFCFHLIQGLVHNPFKHLRLSFFCEIS